VVAPGTGGSVGPNPDASPDLAADVPGSTGGVSSTGGILSHSLGSPAIRDALGAGGNTAAAAQQALRTRRPAAPPILPDAAADVKRRDHRCADCASESPSDAVCRTLRRLPVMHRSGRYCGSSCGEIPSAGLVAYWGFEGLSDSDQLIPDLSGNGHTLTRGSTATADSSDPTFSTDTPCAADPARTWMASTISSGA